MCSLCLTFNSFYSCPFYLSHLTWCYFALFICIVIYLSSIYFSRIYLYHTPPRLSFFIIILLPTKHFINFAKKEIVLQQQQ